MDRAQIRIASKTAEEGERKGMLSNGKEMLPKAKRLPLKMRGTAAVLCGAAYLAVAMAPATAFAAGGGTSAITQPLDNLKTLVIAVIGAVGVIILAKNVMEFAQAYQQQDSSTMNSALKGIVAGAMMAGVSSVLTFLGF